jgi:hypothetical protein
MTSAGLVQDALNTCLRFGAGPRLPAVAVWSGNCGASAQGGAN